MRAHVRLVPAVAVAALLMLPALGGAAPSVSSSHRLQLAQLAATAGCVAQPDDEAYADKGCARGKGLMDANAVVISPDGASVYVAATGSSAVAGFTRRAETGALRQNYCISANGTTGADGTKGACVDGDSLSGAVGVTVSGDGKFVYATSAWSSGVAVLARDESTGSLRQVSCVRAVKTCVSARALNGARAIALTPDGLNAYVAASWADAVSEFRRDPETGLLAPIGCISDDGTDRMCDSGNALRGPTAIVASPDGRQVYVAAEYSDAVLTFARDPKTGLLSRRGCIMQDAPRKGSCTAAKGLFEPGALALAPDGRTLYATAYGSNAVSVFSRNPATGALRWIGCESEVYVDEETGKEPKDGCGHGRPLAGPTGIAVSPDGNRLFVTLESGLTVLDRDRTSGALSVSGCLTYRGFDDEAVEKGCQLASGIAGASAVAVSRDGRNVYVTSWGSDALTTLAPGPTLSAPSVTAGVLSVRVSCPAARGQRCTGRLRVTPDAPFRQLAQSRRYRADVGASTLVRLRLRGPVVRALKGQIGFAATVAATDDAHELAPATRLLVLREHVGTRHRVRR